MILATLGTHPQPMDRVVSWLDALITEGTLDEAIIQAAALGIHPSRASAIGVVGTDELEALMRAAARIITHGGPGSILQVLALGRTPIVIARDPAYGEHVDDHQLRFVAWLARRRSIVPVQSLQELRRALASPEVPVDQDLGDRPGVQRIRELLTGREGARGP